jgi:1-deoxy-D-xylulose-5-phosphate reductoisomerase
VFNAANEEAVALFLAGALPFGRISEVIESVLDRHVSEPVRDVETVRAADRHAREQARAVAGQPC